MNPDQTPTKITWKTYDPSYSAVKFKDRGWSRRHFNAHHDVMPRRRLASITISGRPMGNGGTFLEDLKWRRAPPMITARQLRKSGLLEQISIETGIPVSDMSIRWNRYLGCSMCPCSPGFEVKAKSSLAPLFYRNWRISGGDKYIPIKIDRIKRQTYRDHFYGELHFVAGYEAADGVVQ